MDMYVKDFFKKKSNMPHLEEFAQIPHLSQY